MPASRQEAQPVSAGELVVAVTQDEAAQRLGQRLLVHIRRSHGVAASRETMPPTSVQSPPRSAASSLRSTKPSPPNRLKAPTETRIELALTNNQCTMISVRREPGRYRLRLHHIFAEAGPDVVAALGRYVTRAERSASAVLGEFISANQERLSPVAPRPAAAAREPQRPEQPGRPLRIEPRGQHHDLGQLFAQLNGDYFGGAIQAAITWGQRKRQGAAARRHKSLQLGSYAVEDALIRIHPTLDRPEVPGYFVCWIIYHEMLHQKHGISVIAGRRRFHTPAFLAEERLFDNYEQAQLWERQNQQRLLWY